MSRNDLGLPFIEQTKGLKIKGWPAKGRVQGPKCKLDLTWLISLEKVICLTCQKVSFYTTLLDFHHNLRYLMKKIPNDQRRQGGGPRAGAWTNIHFLQSVE